MKYICAGNNHQFLEYCEQHHLGPKDATYVHFPYQIMGLHNVEIIKVGTWYKNRDMVEAVKQVELTD